MSIVDSLPSGGEILSGVQAFVAPVPALIGYGVDQIFGVSSAATAAYADLKARWDSLFKWAGGDAKHLIDRVHESHSSVEAWLKFSQAWESGTHDTADLTPQGISLLAVESAAKERGYGAPTKPLAKPPEDANALMGLLHKADDVIREVPILGSITDPAKGGPLAATAWKDALCKLSADGLSEKDKIARRAICNDGPWLTDGQKVLLVAGGVSAALLALYITTQAAQARRIAERNDGR